MTLRDRREVLRLEAELAHLRAELQANDEEPAPKKARAIGPNAGLTAWFQRRLEAEIEAMSRSVTWWTRAAYRKQYDRIDFAQDAVPADLLSRVLAALRQRWGNRFDELGTELATKFAQKASKTTDQAIEAALRAAEIRVTLQITEAQLGQVAAAVQQGVSLIRSIPEQYFTSVEGAVMRSVQAGRDLASLTQELEASYGVTHRRAAFIAKDQNNKATAALNRTRQIELGIEQAVWVHSGAGKHPRPTHVRAGQDKVVYNVAQGWLDPAIGKRIWPGTEPGCRCKSRSLIPGLDVGERKAA